MSPYISTPIYIPEETTYFLCRTDGTREQHRLTFVVFRAEGAAEDDWEDDPMLGRLQMAVPFLLRGLPTGRKHKIIQIFYQNQT